MIERRDVVSRTTELVVRETTFEGRPAAEYDRPSAWLLLTTRQVQPEDKWLGRLAELPNIHDSTRQFIEIAEKYDRIARSVEHHALDGVTETELLAALVVIRELREKLQTDEARLLGAARRKKITWARIAAALGLKSRQAAERRHLQLRADLDEVKGKPLKQAERVAYARALRDRPDEQAWAEQHCARAAELGTELARCLTALPLPHPEARPAGAPTSVTQAPGRAGLIADLGEVLAGLAALETAGPVQSASDLNPERYAAGWRTEYTLRLLELLGWAREDERAALRAHPRLRAAIDEFCAAAGTVAHP
ncbi:hypothetical protein ACIA98_21995 [Streptomyces sp. NPDC051366]|uniref:hypothetical protein n=1 Tax=Streptomyces sp. NPDC051366 TaxID=3365652 RepID=UPI00379427E8